MVSFEVQATAEFLIQEVDLIEKSGRQFRSLQQQILRSPSQSNHLMTFDSQDTLADDLSSHYSDSDQSQMDRDIDSEKLHSDPGLMEWRDHFLLTPESEASSMSSGECWKAKTTQWKLAMYQVMQNADLKARKLECEVLMLRRLYEDAKLSIERYENRIDSLERQLSPRIKHQTVLKDADIPNPANLRMENHLNKLLTSRNKALDENVELKKQLLACCPNCRRQGGRDATTDQTCDADTGGQSKLQTQSPARRPNFQKTAFTLVQKMGGRQNSKTTVGASGDHRSNNLHAAEKTSRPIHHFAQPEGGGSPANSPLRDSRLNIPAGIHSEVSRIGSPAASATDKRRVFRMTTTSEKG